MWRLMLALLLLPAVLPALAAERWETLPPTPAPIATARSGQAQANGISIHYAIYGRGPPVMFMHGGLANSDYWGDQVVGLEAPLFEAGQVEGVHRVADQWELRPQIVRRIRPMRLIVGIHLGAERALGQIEHHGEMRRLFLRLHVAQKLPQHIAETKHGIELQAVRLAVDRRQRVVGAKNVTRAVDQKDVVASLHRLGGRLRRLRISRCFLRAGHDDD